MSNGAGPLEGRHAQSLRHLRALAAGPGVWELRALRRQPGQGSRMLPRGSVWITVTATEDGVLYQGLDAALAWADRQDQEAAEIFVGVNPRDSAGGKTAATVSRVSACFCDLDLGGAGYDEALIALVEADAPVPTVVVDSGHGVHAVWALAEASPEKVLWRQVQHALVSRFRAFGADPVPAGDAARVLRLVPYPNRKTWPEGIPTSILYESDLRHQLAELAAAIAPRAGRAPGTGTPGDAGDMPFPAPGALPLLAAARPEDEEKAAGGAVSDTPPLLLTPERLEELVTTVVAVRGVLDRFVRAHMRQGLHYGVIPPEPGREPGKPTLFKAGAELIVQLMGWRAFFLADLETLSMQGPTGQGVIAYICQMVDTRGQVVAQGRGLAEVREPNARGSPNIAAKMAEKRAYVNATLRGAGLSSYFTQDLDDVVLTLPPPPGAVSVPTGIGQGGAGGADQGAEVLPRRGGCTATQRRDIQAWLERAGLEEPYILRQLDIADLRELSRDRANRVIKRLVELATAGGRRP